MAQPKEPTQKQTSNLLFALAVIAVVGGGVLLFMRSSSPQPAPIAEAATASTAATADPAPASSSTSTPLAQAALPIATEPPKKRPPANSVLPPLNLEQGLAALSRYVATESLEHFEQRNVGGDDMMVFRRHWRSLGRRAQQPQP